ncbi:hypothetical protein [Burkholderia pseudomallei]|uniref:hypothetical protein n=1 Tax=Burkholderia pseudomallei TaxID=28450 RepID=UPI000A1A26B0|nr:hypothetical protein [Burkholderia pseudomallei]ARL04214.1 hypothetical protein BOC44_20765 [Burkholderia pseudomallei]
MATKRVPKKTLHERKVDADVRASSWLADGNEAAERGDTARAEECWAKSQFWLDRYNLLAGASDKPSAKG